MIITTTNLIQESLAKHNWNYELSGDSGSKKLFINASDAMLMITVAESAVYISGMHNQKIPANQVSRLRELCKKLNGCESYNYSIQSRQVMCISRISHVEIENNPDIVHQKLLETSNKLTNFYVYNTEVPTSGRQSLNNSSLKSRLEAVSASVSEALRTLESLKDELENYKDLIEEKAQTARDRADSYSSWNERAEDKASELEDKFSDIEGLYDEIDSAYDELFHAEMSLSSAVMGVYVLD